MQLRADSNFSHNGIQRNDDGLTALKLEVRQQVTRGDYRPEHASQYSDDIHNGNNSKPPSSVPIISLCAVNISFTFSYLSTGTLVPRKRSLCKESVVADQLDRPRISRGGVLNPAGFDERSTETGTTQPPASQSCGSKPFLEDFDDSTLMISSAPNQASSADTLTDLFSSASGDESDETQSIVFSSQGSAFVQSQDESREADLNKAPSSCFLSMNALIDGAFRSMICPRPIGAASGIKMETSNLERRLVDIAPSTFSPGYSEAVAARGPLIPTIARFLTSFLQKTKRIPVTTKKDELIQQSPQVQSTENFQTYQIEDEGGKLKGVVKTHLWMTMTNALRDPQPARRLKPLQRFRKPVVVDSNDRLGIEQTDIECIGCDGDSDHQMLEEDYNAPFEPICHDAGYDCDMLENVYEEDGADDYGDYEPDLFEEYEERLRNACVHEKAGGTEFILGNDYCSPKLQPMSRETSSGLYSPMLEPQEEFLQQGPAELTSDTTLLPPAKSFPASSLGESIATSNDGGDDDWTDLLDEEGPGEPGDLEADKGNTRPSTSLEEDYEPSFEQWEFDREQGYDGMLFD